ncbi:G-protein coupled receptor 55 isoform X2 [Echeneis naucrates]|uniref:G-protein coupled receptor 55 isoform X2 n=1 Tax=Echeneis naucrates TaxID=173247 RepID=UPI0011134503|nr:G-protein coupled receptor 55-like isoform X2 [Echeneis naucrates]
MAKGNQASSLSANMTDNCSFEEVDDLMVNLQLYIYVPIFVIGLVLNVAALFVFCVLLRKWTESTIYMTSLTLMDLLLLIPLPFKMHATKHKWIIALQSLCSALENFYFVGIYGSIYTIMCIAVDRWVAICFPFRAKQLRSPKAALVICVLVWLLVLAVISPTIHRVRDTGGKGDFRCFHKFSDNGWSPPLIICLQLFGFLLPALVVIYCSVQTILALQQSGQHSPKSRACVKIIYSCLSAFLVPFTLSHLGIFLQFLVHQNVIKECASKTSVSLFIQIAMCLSNITCCLDAACYYFIAKEVRNPKDNIRLTVSQRRNTFSTSEV